MTSPRSTRRLRALIEQNNLEPLTLAAGRVLRLPPPRFHVVGRGESFEEVARRYNMDPRSLGLLNRMQPPYAVRPGDRLVLPAMARAIADEPQGAPAARPGQAGRFGWPLNGEVAARFGAQPGGQRLDGVEIAGTVGESVKAAADGQVVFAGESVPNHGVIVLIAHADNYVTAYAYNLPRPRARGPAGARGRNHRGIGPARGPAGAAFVSGAPGRAAGRSAAASGAALAAPAANGRARAAGPD